MTSVLLKNVGSLIKEKIRKWGQKNVPESTMKSFEELEKLQNNSENLLIDSDNETGNESKGEEKKFLLLGKSFFNSKTKK